MAVPGLSLPCFPGLESLSVRSGVSDVTVPLVLSMMLVIGRQQSVRSVTVLGSHDLHDLG